LYFFFWPLCCLFFFDIRILIAPLVSFVHCVVCSSSIYGFWLPLWYLLSIVLSVLLRYTDSDYFFFGIFKLLFYYRRYNCLLRLFAEVVLLVFNVYFSVSWYFLCFSSFCVVLLVFNVYFSLSWYFLCFSSFCAVCQIVYMSLWFTCFQRPWRFLAFQSVNWVVDRDRMIVGFTTTYVIGAYHHFSCEFEYRSGEV
jgi:hypothetical protein